MKTEWANTFLDSIEFAPEIEDSMVHKHVQSLTMPPGALSKVLAPFIRVRALSKKWPTDKPLQFASILFAGDHEIATAASVSAFTQEVTKQMLRNFIQGGAAQNVLARARQAPLTVVDIGVARTNRHEISRTFSNQQVQFIDAHIPTILSERNNDEDILQKFARGCQDQRNSPSLGSEAATLAFEKGREITRHVLNQSNFDIVILGEMGIGNTTCSAAIAEIVLDSQRELTGIGTGVTSLQLIEKSRAIREMRIRFREKYGTLRNLQNLGTGRSQKREEFCGSLYSELGGFEHAALAGAAVEAAVQKKFILLDGLIVTAALAPLFVLSEQIKSWIIAGHESAEPAHKDMLDLFGLEPLLKLNLRLGEGSGAMLAAGLIQDAERLVLEMATFSSAGVSQLQC